MEVDSSSVSKKTAELILPQKLSKEDEQKLNSLLPELNADFERRCKMLLDRLDVTVMSFFGSSTLGSKEDELKEIYNNAKENIVVPKPAGIQDLYNAKKDLLRIQKSQTSNKTEIHQYTLDEAPPSRGGTQKLYSCMTSGFSSRGRNFRRGRGRGGHPGPKNSLQQQIHEEINRQLSFDDNSQGPYHGNAKRGRGRH
ncbi:hypothetical protein FO519_005876 [Halicephalobus sp. NKZ332]|nr:hypothetical protein FO519_005876 [Halicephalobus sp. NKZ332]